MLLENKICYGFLFLLFLTALPIFIYTLILPEPKCFNPTPWEGKPSKTGEIYINNKTFSVEDYDKINDTHLGVCFEHKLNVLRRCCKSGQILSVINNVTCVDHEVSFEDLLTVYDENENPIPEFNLSNFYHIYALTCPNSTMASSFIKQKKDGGLMLRRDGTLFIPSNGWSLNPGYFCLDLIEDIKGIGLGLMTCLGSETASFILKLHAAAFIISTFFLLTIFLLHVMIKELRTLQGLFHMCHAVSLSIFYTFLAIQKFIAVMPKTTFCIITGYAIQFSVLASFFWLNTMCADMWWSFRTFRPTRQNIPQSNKKKFFFCCCYSWGGPGLISLISLIMDFHPDISEEFTKPNIGRFECLVNQFNQFSAIYYLYGPMSVIMILNIFFFISTAVKIFRTKRETQMLENSGNLRSDGKPKSFTVYLKLVIVMGIGWTSVILAWAFPAYGYYWVLLNVSQSLQGLYIFIVLLPRIIKVLQKKCHRH